MRRVLTAGLGVLLLAGLGGCATRFHDAAARDGGSRGKPSAGWLAGGELLPERGLGYEVLRTEGEGGLLRGTPRLVGLVRRAARSVYDRTLPPLRVGDLSATRGGVVTRHHSHRNGRDVDLLYFVRDAATDVPVISPGFIRFNREGASLDARVPLRFDVARNWRLVESVVRDHDAAVIRVFCAAWIKRLLLDHARGIGRPAAVIERLEEVLAQPGDSAPHDDHFHVRIACNPAERVRGCVDGGPLWPWLRMDWEKDDAATLDDDAVLAMMEPLPPGIEHGPPLPEGWVGALALAEVDAPEGLCVSRLRAPNDGFVCR